MFMITLTLLIRTYPKTKELDSSIPMDLGLSLGYQELDQLELLYVSTLKSMRLIQINLI